MTDRSISDKSDSTQHVTPQNITQLTSQQWMNIKELLYCGSLMCQSLEKYISLSNPKIKEYESNVVRRYTELSIKLYSDLNSK
jgi:hypothetical protein